VLTAARDIERHIHKAPKSVETDSGKRDYEVHFANNTVRQMRLEINHICKPSNSFKKRREKQRQHGRVQTRKLQKYALQQNVVIAETSQIKRQFTKP
jgi:hypothetical protein